MLRTRKQFQETGNTTTLLYCTKITRVKRKKQNLKPESDSVSKLQSIAPSKPDALCESYSSPNYFKPLIGSYSTHQPHPTEQVQHPSAYTKAQFKPISTPTQEKIPIDGPKIPAKTIDKNTKCKAIHNVLKRKALETYQSRIYEYYTQLQNELFKMNHLFLYECGRFLDSNLKKLETTIKNLEKEIEFSKRQSPPNDNQIKELTNEKKKEETTLKNRKNYIESQNREVFDDMIRLIFGGDNWQRSRIESIILIKDTGDDPVVPEILNALSPNEIDGIYKKLGL